MNNSQNSTAFAPESNLSSTQSGDVFLIALHSHQHAEWQLGADHSLSELLTLPSNWNSYEAKPADEQSIDAARSLVKLLSGIVSVQEPDIGLTPDGLVTLSWELKADREVEVEIGQTGTMSINHFDDTKDLHQSFRTGDLGQLVELLTRWSQEG